MAATIQQLLDDIDALKQNAVTLKSQRDAAVAQAAANANDAATADQRVADAQAAQAAATAERDALQAGIDSAFAAAEDAKAASNP